MPTLSAIERYRQATVTVRLRAESWSLDAHAWAALVDCLDETRPFCFLRSVDNVERVAMRHAWEGIKRARREAFRSEAVSRYKHVRSMLDPAVQARIDTMG